MKSAGLPADFSIVLGGPLYQLLRRARMTDDALHLARRRMALIAAIAWLPLAALATLAAAAPGAAPLDVPFLKDIQAHVRFLVALPLLVGAELLVHARLRPVAKEFLERGLVPEACVARFHDCVRAAFSLRNSVAAELAMVALVYGFGVPIVWRHFTALDVATWYSTPSNGAAQLTAAGYWYAYVSVPLFQFLVLRWYFRIVVWARFLWQVSRIPLNLSAMHPDGHAGLGFLAGKAYAFAPLLMAHGAMLSGAIANRIFYQGSTLAASRYEIVLLLAWLLVVVFAPLLAFAPQVAAAKRKASNEYARLAQAYVTQFEAKWLPSGRPPAASPLGDSDLQSLADMNNSYATVKGTRTVAVTRDAVMALALATLVPLAPLLLTMISLDEILKRLLKLVI